MATAKKKNDKNNKSLVPTEDIPLAMPGMVDGIQPGMECVDDADIVLPRLALVQAMSKCVDLEDDEAPKPGTFLNTLTMKQFKPPVKIVPIFYNKAAVKFPDTLNEPIECQSRDSISGTAFGTCAKCEYCWNIWTDGPPQCTVIHEFISVLEDENPKEAFPFIVSMMRSSAKVGKQWISIAKISRAPLFAATYQLGRESKETDKGKFFVFTVKPAGRIDPNPYTNLYRGLFDAYKGGRVGADYDKAPDRVSENGEASFDPEEIEKS